MKTIRKTAQIKNRLSAPPGRALLRAAKFARKTAQMYGTPIYIMRDGQIVAEKP